MKLSTFFIALCFLPFPALALQIPQPAPGDQRVKFVNYDPLNVVKVVGHFGYQTFILFSNDETITDIGGGDTDAWDIGVSEKKNSIFIKPKAVSPATNITVVTNKHYYNFDLTSAPKKAKNMYFMVAFRYPSDEAKQKKILSDAQKSQDLLNDDSESTRNENYWVQGSESLTPTTAYDDNNFTYLTFPGRKEFPAVYVVGEDGKESIVNTTIEGDTMVVQSVAKKLVLRKGKLVTCVFNESYDPIGVSNTTKTVSPKVERVIRGSES